jgi:hypothetical protein
MDKIGACGDNCTYCPRFKATNDNDPIELNRLKELWVSLGLKDKDIDPETLKCSGCSKENNCAYNELRDCAFAQGYENCGLCSKYPCALVQSAFSKTEDLFRKFDSRCSTEHVCIEKAFRYKKDNLDRINHWMSRSSDISN